MRTDSDSLPLVYHSLEFRVFPCLSATALRYFRRRSTGGRLHGERKLDELRRLRKTKHFIPRVGKRYTNSSMLARPFFPLSSLGLAAARQGVMPSAVRKISGVVVSAKLLSPLNTPRNGVKGSKVAATGIPRLDCKSRSMLAVWSSC